MAMKKPAGRAAQPTKMKDIAAELGLSVSTVSRVLSRPDLVNEATRARVLDLVQQLEYRPNLAARDLRRQQSGIVLVVVPRLSAFFLDVFLGAENAGRQNGYLVLMAHTERDPQHEAAFFQQVVSGRADGIILVTSADGTKLARRRGALPPTVASLEAVDGLAIPTVRIDNVAGGRMATEHLISLGHQRIAHISGPSHMPMAQHRVEGFRSAIAESGLDPQVCYVVEGDFTLPAGEAAMARLLTRHPRPTAIFAGNDEMAIGAIEAISRAGLHVGRDISVVGFDDQRIASLYIPALTTVHVPMVELGHRAVMELANVINGRAAAQEILLPTRLVVRETTGPAPADRRHVPRPRHSEGASHSPIA